jgi:hypothetical protein
MKPNIAVCKIVKMGNPAYLKFTIGEGSQYFTSLVIETDSTLYHTIKSPKSKISFKVMRVSVEEKQKEKGIVIQISHRHDSQYDLTCCLTIKR